MVWNKNTPGYNEPISYGDDRIRELKTDLGKIFDFDFSSIDWRNDYTKAYHKIPINPTNPRNYTLYIKRTVLGTNDYLYYLCIKTPNGEKILSAPCRVRQGVLCELFQPGDILVLYQNTAPAGWVLVSLDTTYLPVLYGIDNNNGVGLNENWEHTHVVSVASYVFHTHGGSVNVNCGGVVDGKKEGYKVSGGTDLIKNHHYHTLAGTIDNVNYIGSGAGGSFHTHTLSTVVIGNYKRANCILARKV